MNGAKVFFGQSYPMLSVNGRPKITSEAPAQVLAVVVNFSQRLMTLITAFGLMLRHHGVLQQRPTFLRTRKASLDRSMT